MGINWDTVVWTGDERSFVDAAKAVLVVNSKQWKDYSVEKIVEYMKRSYRDECFNHDQILPWLSTGGLVVMGTLREGYGDSQIFMSAALASYYVQKYLEANKAPAKEKTNWRLREIERFRTGHYKPVPWYEHEKWVEWVMKEPQLSHFVHISKDGKALAYTKHEENGQNDLKTRISPDVYLDKFVKGEEYRDYIEEWLETWYDEHDPPEDADEEYDRDDT